jgi:hypothetical protein
MSPSCRKPFCLPLIFQLNINSAAGIPFNMKRKQGPLLQYCFIVEATLSEEYLNFVIIVPLLDGGSRIFGVPR